MQGKCWEPEKSFLTVNKWLLKNMPGYRKQWQKTNIRYMAIEKRRKYGPHLHADGFRASEGWHAKGILVMRGENIWIRLSSLSHGCGWILQFPLSQNSTNPLHLERVPEQVELSVLWREAWFWYQKEKGKNPYLMAIKHTTPASKTSLTNSCWG